MRKAIIILFCCMLAMATQTAYAQQQAPTEREFNIYYDFIEKIHTAGAQNKEAFKRTCDRIAADHGITTDELNAIDKKITEYGPTAKEEAIFYELTDKLAALGRNATKEQKDAAEAEIRRKYGLSEVRLEDIIMRSLPF